MTNCIYIENNGLECNKRGIYNIKEFEPKYCNKHRLKDMINVKNKKCFECKKNVHHLIIQD